MLYQQSVGSPTMICVEIEAAGCEQAQLVVIGEAKRLIYSGGGGQGFEPLD